MSRAKCEKKLKLQLKIKSLFADPHAENYPGLHIPMYTFGWMFSVINPLIYVVFNEAYKESLKETLSAAIFCTKKKC